jgi:hypothetical protein
MPLDRYYAVKSGDTIAKIAAELNLDPDDLLDFAHPGGQPNRDTLASHFNLIAGSKDERGRDLPKVSGADITPTLELVEGTSLLLPPKPEPSAASKTAAAKYQEVRDVAGIKYGWNPGMTAWEKVVEAEAPPALPGA